MKTPDPAKAESSVTRQGSPIIRPGGYPCKLASVTAEVLARLLGGEELESLEAVHSSSTTRLAACVYYLENRYRWQIDRRDHAAGCADGRVSWVVRYHMNPHVVAAAAADGARAWCSDVQAARRALRSKAAQAMSAAAGMNAAASAPKRNWTRPALGER